MGGKLIYLSHTRLNITYVVSVVSQFMHAPLRPHLEAIYRIVRYLKGTLGKQLLFQKGDEFKLEAYTNVDWTGSMTDKRSIVGYCTFLGGNLVTQRSKKQLVMACSSAQAEFRAMTQGICELLWLKIIPSDLKVKVKSPMMLYCDNKTTINITYNLVQHDMTKYVEIERHFYKRKS